MVARGGAQKAARNESLQEHRAAARGQRTATTSSATDQTRALTGTLRTRTPRLRRVKIRL